MTVHSILQSLPRYYFKVGAIAGTTESLKNLAEHNNNKLFIPVSVLFSIIFKFRGGRHQCPPSSHGPVLNATKLHQCTGNPTDLGLLPSTSKKVARKKRTDCHSISRRSKGGSSHRMFVFITLTPAPYFNYLTFLLFQESKLPNSKEKRPKVHNCHNGLLRLVQFLPKK